VDSHKVIPILPCTDLIETLNFYGALGFEVTYEQTDPYTYAAVQRSGAEIHFYGGFKKSERSGHTCLVMVPEVRLLHAQFVEGLRLAFGRLPTAGFPRITRLRSGQGRFGVFDPAGNSITFVAPDEDDVDYYQEQQEKQSRLAWALDTAVWLRDIKGFDDVAAARVLDAALARNEPAAPIELARALAARAGPSPSATWSAPNRSSQSLRRSRCRARSVSAMTKSCTPLKPWSACSASRGRNRYLT
jgi:hypothetical protein